MGRVAVSDKTSGHVHHRLACCIDRSAVTIVYLGVSQHCVVPNIQYTRSDVHYAAVDIHLIVILLTIQYNAVERQLLSSARDHAAALTASGDGSPRWIFRRVVTRIIDVNIVWIRIQ